MSLELFKKLLILKNQELKDKFWWKIIRVIFIIIPIIFFWIIYSIKACSANSINDEDCFRIYSIEQVLLASILIYLVLNILLARIILYIVYGKEWYQRQDFHMPKLLKRIIIYATIIFLSIVFMEYMSMSTILMDYDTDSLGNNIIVITSFILIFDVFLSIVKWFLKRIKH